MRYCVLTICCCHLIAVDLLELQAPLTTAFLSAKNLPAQSMAIQAQVFVPDDAPTDLGVGACIKDDDGNWFQLAHPLTLSPGHHHLHFTLDNTANWVSEPNGTRWNAYQSFLGHEYGLFFWSTAQSRSQITIESLRVISHMPQPNTQKNAMILAENTLRDISLGAQNIVCGQRWSLQFTPDIFPDNPYDEQQFLSDLVITDEAQNTFRFPAFFRQPGTFIDRGEHEIMRAEGHVFFEARFRPKKPGRYQAQLHARWGNNANKIIPLPDIIVSGEPSDPYVYVDKKDPRFLSIGRDNPEFFWPVGMNIRSITDPRGTKRTRSQRTPVRIVHAYKAYLDRLALAGGNCAEIWLSSWNLALEWKDQWPGFHGIGAYHEANAERIDQILDYAWGKNIRIIFVVNNHGQASTKADTEWKDSPYNMRNGGPLRSAGATFNDPAAMKLQQRYRRYLVARYADHPAILCWKLWTEMNLTNGSRRNLKTWHQQAFQKWRTLDAYYQHPRTTHWSGDYKVPDRNIVRLPEMDMVAIDAYHKNGFLPHLLYSSTLHSHRGLARYNKPIVVTEYGGNWDACPLPQLRAEHAIGAWCALVSGHASSPHLWWFEWADQNNYWLPFRSISNFIQGEDLRSGNTGKARSVKLDIRDPTNKNRNTHYWARAWARSGSILGYIVDHAWANNGRAQPLHQQQHIIISNNAKTGRMHLQWWDAQRGTIISDSTIHHTGGELRIAIPDFRRHIAFKLKRLPVPKATEL